MKNREDLENKLQKILSYEVRNTKLLLSRFDQLKELGLTEDNFARFLHLRENVTAASDSILYYLCLVYLEKNVKDYFLPKEIKQYNKLDFSEPKLKTPLILKMIKINDQQYIGKITAQELKLWRNAQIVNYNENAQRTLRKLVKRGKEIFQITLNTSAVESVMSLMENGGFISNTLTFNIPDDVSYSYDEQDNTLAIDIENKKLDILDGYHRYIAISKMLNKDEDFDYEMEIRIVQFTESKAQQFIWQEDQKTKMSKSQSSAMNQYKLANQIVQRLNDNGSCDLYHHIESNGIVNKGYFAQMVDKIYCNNVPKKSELKVQKTTVNNLTKYLNKVVAEDDTLLEHRWDRLFTYSIVFLSDKTTENICEKAKLLTNMIKDDKKYMFTGNEIYKTDLAKLTKMWKEIQDAQ